MTTVSTAIESRLDEHTRFPTAIFSVHLRRKPLYYVINLIVPCCLLSLIAISSFLLQPGSFDRTGLGTYAYFLYPAALGAAHSARISVIRKRFWDFFAPNGLHVAPIGVKFGVEASTKGCAYYPNFQRPLAAAKLCVGGEHVLGASKVRTSCIAVLSFVGLGYRAPPGGGGISMFCCYCLFLFVRHAFEWQSLWTPHRHHGVRIRKRPWYRLSMCTGV